VETISEILGCKAKLIRQLDTSVMNRGRGYRSRYYNRNLIVALEGHAWGKLKGISSEAVIFE